MKIAFCFLIACSSLLMGGCASPVQRRTEQLPPPIALDQIKEMSAKGVSEQTIIAALRATRAAYYLTTAHVLDLQKAGVPQSVIDYLLSTPQIFPPPPRRYYYYSPSPFWWYDWHDYHHHDHHH